jgi:putative intracellular protease/amidase
MVVANASVSTTTGWPVGFWASELIHAYDAFTRRGYDLVIASPDGGKVELDAYADPRDASGYSKDDNLSLDYLNRPEFVSLLENTGSVRELESKDFDAIVVAGGQSPMFTFQDATNLQSLFLRFHADKKVVAALCHGTSLLLYLKNQDGSPFVHGRRMTGFANSEENFADQAVGRKLMPFYAQSWLYPRTSRAHAFSAQEPNRSGAILQLVRYSPSRVRNSPEARLSRAGQFVRS